MSASQLQHYLTDKIYSIQDEEFLSALKILVDAKDAAKEVYRLNERQLQAIAESERQIANGEVYTNDDVFYEIEQWLAKK